MKKDIPNGRQRPLTWFGLSLILILTACSTSETPVGTSNASPAAPESNMAVSDGAGTAADLSRYDDLEIVTLLPRDAIPAIDNPTFLTAAEADAVYDPTELILGVSFGGESRAYSVPFLSRHEIVNDTVAGVKLAVTW